MQLQINEKHEITGYATVGGFVGGIEAEASSLPESFDELGKNAKEHVNKAWNNLTPADIKDFSRITSMAVKYQDVVRGIQKQRRMLDSAALLNVFAQNER